ncbi:glycerate kinase [Neobacillus piezotolerans]|uniref:Glycerate kinase n=1 Tax=Neobacillus piezotolerans TaxID=2259171 RepID=A0A3D8GVU9_9BACI|nr:glycerate kinase [Neobacillus piezotolerans]RDU38329.1 glycerate kinase [Neobacillus piezotolerans]
MKKEITIVLAPDSFKECMTAKEACEAMERGINKSGFPTRCIHVPMADGGEGTMRSLADATGGRIFTKTVSGPLGEDVDAEYAILGDGETAAIEMAAASGIHLLPKEKRNPLITSTYGTGQLISACLDLGIKKLLIGIGGSATNDGGAGMVQALGGRFLDENGNELPKGGGSLGKLRGIDLDRLDQRLKSIAVEVACDVSNPLCGPEGASRVFGPQKGASPEMVETLDENLRNFAEVIKKQLGNDVIDIPGAGAAGGLGAGLMAFMQASLKPGISLIIEYTGLEERVKNADMVWTGEGSIDFQTQYGKTPYGVAELAKNWNKPVIAFAGKIGNAIEPLYEKIDAIFGITEGAVPLEEALAKGPRNLERASENVARLLAIKKDCKFFYDE